MAEFFNEESEETLIYRHGFRPNQFEPVRNNDNFNNVHNNSDETSSNSSKDEDDGLTKTPWCFSNNLTIMPTLAESLCCCEIRPVFRKMINMGK